MKDIADGVAKIQKVDPLGVNAQRQLIDSLRDVVTKAEEKASIFTGGIGEMRIRDRIIRFDVPAHEGAFRVTVYVDNPANWIWLNHHVDDTGVDLRQPYFAFADKWVEDQRKDVFVAFGESSAPDRAHRGADLERNILAHKGVLATQDSTLCESAFHSWLNRSADFPLGNTPYPDIQDQGLTPGRHVVAMVVTPVSNGPNGRWRFRGRLLAIAPGGGTSVFKEVDIDSADYSNLPLGKPAPEVRAVLVAEQPRKI
jgi:hypothetical protein